MNNTLTEFWKKNHKLVLTFSCPICNTLQKRSICLLSEHIDFIMKLALFGGTNYWCVKTEAVQNSNFSDYELILRGGSLLFYIRNVKEAHIFNLEKFLSGVIQAYKMGVFNGWKECEEDGFLKLSYRICDAIIQFGLFGKIRFNQFKRGDTTA